MYIVDMHAKQIIQTHTHKYIHTVHTVLGRLLTNCNPFLIQKCITEMVSHLDYTGKLPRFEVI